jgi:hypothetical protein
MAYNVSAVHEAPELTARSAQEFPPPFTTHTLHNLRWQARASAPCVTPSLLDEVGPSRHRASASTALVARSADGSPAPDVTGSVRRKRRLPESTIQPGGG